MNSSEDQPAIRNMDSYRPQARFDLTWIFYPAEHNWVAHDALSGEFYRFNEYEYAAVRLMDGTRALPDLLTGMRETFGPVRVELEWIQSLIQRLQMCFLLQPSQDSFRLIEKHDQQSKKKNSFNLLNSLLAIRIPLFDPGPLLDWFYPFARALFSRWTAAVVLLLGVMLAWLVVRWAVANDMPLWNPSQFTIDRWILLFLCYVIAKTLHEFGHLLACSRFKVRSSEVGIMLLCLMPCFYCDTTPSWKLPSKWHRALVAASGIYVELIIAAIAMLGWLFFTDGILRFLCLHMAVVCSISTLFLNANPLLRYDGYYMLSDLWGIPNLHAQSHAALRYMFSRFILLQKSSPVSFDGNPVLLSIFAVLSWLYRIFVLSTILWLIWTFLPPLGLQLVAVIVTMSLAAGIVISYLRSIRNAFRSCRRLNRSDQLVASVMWGGLLVGSICLLFVPFRRSTIARGYVDYADKSPIYATYDSRIHQIVDKYSQINAGSLMISLESPDALWDIAKLNGEIQQAEVRLEQLKLLRTIDPETEYKIPPVEAELDRLRARYVVLSREYSALEHYAPMDGFLIDSLARPKVDLTSMSESRFKPTFLEKENVGGWVSRSTLLGWFSEMREPIVIAIIPEAMMNGVIEGGSAWVRLDGKPFQALPGKIISIAPEKLTSIPAALIGDQSLASIPSEDGGFKTESPHYAVTISLEKDLRPLHGAVATISIPLELVPIHRHISDFVRKTIRPAIQ